MIEVDVVGGLYDGAVIETARYPDWGWVGPDGDDHRLWGAPAPGRELYRLAPPIRGTSRVYFTAERTHRLCDSCGGITVASGCALCGAGLPTA